MTGMTTLAIFLGFFGGMTIGQLVVAKYQGVTRPKSVSRLPREAIFRHVAVVFGFLASFLQPRHVPLAFVLVGSLIMLFGTAFTLWSQSVLGRNWIPGIGTHHSHKLVTDGPYAHIRHPIYTGVAIVVVGGAICCTNLLLLVAGALLWLSMAIRIPHEENLMHKKFKKRWERYEETTGSFVPRVRR